MDQRLRLQAEVRDNASPKLKAIGKELKEIRRTPGMEQAQKWFAGFNETAEGFVKSGGGVAGIMGSIGIGGLTAAASLGVLVKQLKELGDHTFALKKLGQETGLTIDELRKWEYVGQVFRVPVDEMDAALKTLGDQMVDFKRRRGELFGQLNQLDPKFAEKLQLEDTQHQLQDIFTWLSRIPDAATRNRWAKEFFGTDDINNLLVDKLPALQQALKDAGNNIQPLDPGFQAKADLLNKSVVDFNAAWQNFEVNIGPTVFTELKQAADDFTDVFNQIKAVWDFIKAEKAKPVGEIVGDVADVAKNAAAAKAAEVEQRWKDRAAAVRAGQGLDGNALHRNDEMPAGFHRTAFITGLGGSDDGLAGGVKEGVLAAFREWAAQSSGTGTAGGDGAPGLTNAAYTTFGSDGGSLGGGGGSGGGGGFHGTGGSNLSGGDAAGEHAEYIRQLAKKYGIDPRLAVAVANSEGLNNPVGDHGTSFGDFQLHTGGGLGDIFRKQTGLDPSDQSNWKAADDWALKYASKNGWGPWHGAARIGVTGMMGIGGQDAAGGTPGSSASAVDNAMKLLGAGSGAAARAFGAKMTPGEWCADFVNGAFKSAGMKGVNGSMAQAFSAWGTAVGVKDVKKGDVILERHGNHIGHVGLATGAVQRDANGNITGVGMVSGNYGHAVRQNWERLNEIGGLRRAIPSLVDEARKAAAPAAGASDGSIEAHVHIHDGQVRGATARSSGIVKPPRVNLRRGPTMTEASVTA